MFEKNCIEKVEIEALFLHTAVFRGMKQKKVILFDTGVTLVKMTNDTQSLIDPCWPGNLGI